MHVVIELSFDIKSARTCDPARCWDFKTSISSWRLLLLVQAVSSLAESTAISLLSFVFSLATTSNFSANFLRLQSSKQTYQGRLGQNFSSCSIRKHRSIVSPHLQVHCTKVYGQSPIIGSVCCSSDPRTPLQSHPRSLYVHKTINSFSISLSSPLLCIVLNEAELQRGQAFPHFWICFTQLAQRWWPQQLTRCGPRRRSRHTGHSYFLLGVTRLQS